MSIQTLLKTLSSSEKLNHSRLCLPLRFHLFLLQVYPGLMVTAGLIHYVLNLLHITVHIRDVCVFLAPVFSGLTSISTFLLTRELWNQGAGLLAACFIAIVPGYISRSVAGSFDNEGIAIFALQFTYYLWVRLCILYQSSHCPDPPF